MSSPVVLAVLAAFLFGSATTLSKFGLRYVSPRTGASISLPATALMFWLAAPFALLTAILFLDEPVTFLIAAGTVTIILGVTTLSWDNRTSPRQWASWVLLIPLLGAAVRGNSQTVMKYGLGLWRNPFAATLICYTVSAIIVWLASRQQTANARAFDTRAVPWFAAVGFCNGSGLFLTYQALQDGAVGVVSPIVTTAPLFTLLLGRLLQLEERFDARVVLGVMATVLGVVLILVH